MSFLSFTDLIDCVHKTLGKPSNITFKVNLIKL